MVAHASLRTKATGGAVRSDHHVARALRLLVLLLVVLLQLRQWLLLLRMHVAMLALRRRPAVAFARVLAVRLYTCLVHHPLLMSQLFLKHIRIAAVHFLDVDDVLVLFILAIIIVVI